MQHPKTTERHGLCPAYLGLGFYWAWIWLTYFSNLPYPAGAPFGVAQQATMFLSMGGMLIAMALCAAGAWPRRATALPTIGALAVLTAAGTFALALLPDEAAMLRGACALLVGIGGGAVLLGWGDIYVGIPPIRISLYVSGSLFLSAAVVVALLLLPQPVAGSIDALLPLVSWALLAVSHHLESNREAPDGENAKSDVAETAASPSEAPNGRKARATLPWRYGAGLAICGLIIGLSLGNAINNAANALQAAGIIIVLGNAASGLIILLYALTTKRDLQYRSVAIVLPPLVVAALVLFYAGSSDIVLFAFALSRVGFGLFDALVWVQMPQTLPTEHMMRLRSFGFVRLALDGGVMGGALVASLVPYALFPESSVLGIVMAFILMIILTLLLQPAQSAVDVSSTSNASEDAVPLPTRNIEGACAAFAENHGLSGRETEVLTLIVKGRTAKNISEELFISVGTVQTHMKNLYKKCGVHSRYELLTALEDSL